MKVIITAFIFPLLLSAQILTKEAVKSSQHYYWGEAVGDIEQEAADHSLKNLVQSIAVGISSSMTRVVAEKNGDIKETYENVVNSYSNATLRDVKYIKRPTEFGIEVFSYIDKKEVTRMFEERKSLVRHLYESAVRYEDESNIADALKYYYFAIILMNSIPDRVIEYGTKNLLTEIPGKINAVISSIRMTLVADRKISEKERELHFEITAAGKPIRTLDFSCWDGSSQVHVRAVDGTGVFRLFGAGVSFDRLDVAIKYLYYESREELKEVSDLWRSVVKPQFKNSQSVSLTVAKPAVAEKPLPADATVTYAGKKYTISLIDKEKCPSVSLVQMNTAAFLETLELKSTDAVRKKYAADPFLAEKLASLVAHNKPVPIDRTVSASLNRTATGWEVRKVRVLTNYPTLNRQATEYLILDFDDRGNLYDVNFGTVEQLYEQFAEQGAYGNDWGNRQTIVKFVEKYRSAFLTRNMPMLDSLFADEAVIIVGREMKKGKAKDDYQFSKLSESQPDIQYTQYTKKQYLANVKKMFQGQKDIFLGYSSFGITKKNNMPGTYGISMKQHYAATTYSDEGHLFLLVDFLQDQPQIYVRSWQPKEWNDEAIIKLANFKLNK